MYNSKKVLDRLLENPTFRAAVEQMTVAFIASLRPDQVYMKVWGLDTYTTNTLLRAKILPAEALTIAEDELRLVHLLGDRRVKQILNARKELQK